MLASTIVHTYINTYLVQIHHVHVNVSTAAVSTMSGVRQYDRLIRHVLELVVHDVYHNCIFSNRPFRRSKLERASRDEILSVRHIFRNPANL
jgi:hypothetical protein